MSKIEAIEGLQASLVEATAGRDGIVVPDAEVLFRGVFTRVGPDLVVSAAEGRGFHVPDYFAAEQKPALVSPQGGMLTPDIVEALAGGAGWQVAQAAGGAAGGLQIGRVELLEGRATALRGGTVQNLAAGDPIFRGDVVATQTGGKLGLRLVDGTVFSLTGGARMVMNELIYDPGGSDNLFSASLVEGTFVFITGQVAKTGTMRVQTPVATMGIRGTTPFVRIDANTGVTEFRILPDPDGQIGRYEIVSLLNQSLLAVVQEVGTGFRIDSPSSPPVQITIPDTQLQQPNDANDAYRLFQQPSAPGDRSPTVPGQPAPPSDGTPGRQGSLQVDPPTPELFQQASADSTRPLGTLPGTSPPPDTGREGDPLTGPILQTAAEDDTSQGATPQSAMQGTAAAPVAGNPLTFALSVVPVTEDSPVVLTGFSFGALPGSTPLSVSLTARSTIGLASTALLVVQGNGTHSVTVSGTASAVLLALNGKTYTPSSDSNTGGLTITIAATDGSGVGGTLDIPISITPVADAPVAGADSALLAGSDTEKSGNVLANDRDPDPGDSVSLILAGTGAIPVDGDVTIVPGVQHELTGAYGTLRINSTGSYIYVLNPSADLPAHRVEDVFHTMIRDATGRTATAALTVAIDPAAGIAAGDPASPGAQTLSGGRGGDTLSGGLGNDVLDGGGQDDSLAGSDGADSLVGRAGADTLAGGASADTLVGGDGSDILTGGSGSDVFRFDSLGARDRITDLQTGDGEDRIDLSNLLNAAGGLGSGTWSSYVRIIAKSDEYVLQVDTDGSGTISGWTDVVNLGESLSGTDPVLVGLPFGNVHVPIGSSGNPGETVLGTDSADTFVGDETSGRSFDRDDIIVGYAGDDTIDAGTGADSVSAGDDNDRVIGGAGRDTLSGEAGNDELFAGNSSAWPIQGGGSGYATDADLLVGGDGNDLLVGDGGADTLAGDAGDDIVSAVLRDGLHADGGSGADTLYASFGSSSDAVVADFETGAFSLDGTPQNVTIRDFEAIWLEGGSGADSILGSSGDDQLYGGQGDDTISGGEGNDVLSVGLGSINVDGGAGIDSLTVNLSQMAGAGFLDLAVGTLSGDAFSETLAITDVEAITVVGGGSGDNLAGSSLGETLEGRGGEDTLDGRAGNDVLDASGGGAGDTQPGDRLIGGDGDDTLHGGSGDTLQGGDGDDWIFGQAGAGVIDGGAGTDRLRVAMWTQTDGVVVDIGTGVMAAADGIGTVTGIELLEGDGGAGDDSLGGVGGNDTLNGQEGSDTLLGRGGDDWLVGDYSGALSGGADRLEGGDGADLLQGEGEADTLLGGAGDDSLWGGAGADLLAGGAGSDRFFLQHATGVDRIADFEKGGSGDILDVSSFLYTQFFGTNYIRVLVQLDGTATVEADLDALGTAHAWETLAILEGTFAGGDTFRVRTGYAMEAVIATTAYNVIAGTPGYDSLTGTAGADSIDARGGDDTISGLGGVDTVLGGTGNDLVYVTSAGAASIDGGADTDTLYIQTDDVGVVVDLTSGTYAVNGIQGTIANVEKLITNPSSGGAITARGAGGDDVLNGSAIADLLTGEGGADQIYGGGGADTLNGGAGHDLLSGIGQAGLDDAAADSLSGGDGNDTLVGGGGADMLDGGAGNDILNGGAGADTVAASALGDIDRITDWQSVDVIDLTAVASWGLANMSGQSVDDLIWVTQSFNGGPSTLFAAKPDGGVAQLLTFDSGTVNAGWLTSAGDMINLVWTDVSGVQTAQVQVQTNFGGA